MKVGKKLSCDSSAAELEAAAPGGLKSGRDFIELSNTISSAHMLWASYQLESFGISILSPFSMP